MSADVNTAAILCMENYGTLTVGGDTLRSVHWVPHLLCAYCVPGLCWVLGIQWGFIEYKGFSFWLS